MDLKFDCGILLPFADAQGTKMYDVQNWNVFRKDAHKTEPDSFIVKAQVKLELFMLVSSSLTRAFTINESGYDLQHPVLISINAVPFGCHRSAHLMTLFE